MAQDLGLDGAVRWEHLFDGTRGEVHTGLGHDGVNHLGSAREGCATGGVLAQTGALEAFLVLLVALLTGLLVFLNQADVAQGEAAQIKGVDDFGKVLVELAVFHWAFGVHLDHHGAVRQLL